MANAVCKICNEADEAMYICCRCKGFVCRYHVSANAAEDKAVCFECEAKENLEEY